MYRLSIRLLFVLLFFACTSFKNDNKDHNSTLSQKRGHDWEAYDPGILDQLQSIEDLISYADSVIGPEHRQTLIYSELLTDLVRRRFYHGYSYYLLRENWVAWLAGNFIWDHLHAIVLPDDIMKHPMAACSQQAIVLLECFERVGIDYREVDLNGHFVLEGKVGGGWLLFDPNLEPNFVSGRKSLDALIKTGELYNAYKGRLDQQQIDSIFIHPVYRKVNDPIAPNATLFQQVTGFLSFILPLMLPLLLFYCIINKRSNVDKEPNGVKFIIIKENVAEEEKTLSGF